MIDDCLGVLRADIPSFLFLLLMRASWGFVVFQVACDTLGGQRFDMGGRSFVGISYGISLNR